ncbi:MAG: hypothetical protein U1F16_05245 [Turneriella sp.]
MAASPTPVKQATRRHITVTTPHHERQKEYRKSYTLDEAANFSAANGNTASLAIYETLNITDIGIRGAISFRLY